MANEYLMGEPMRLGAGPHLFMDDSLIEDAWAVVHRVNPPYPHLGNPVIVADRPWEERPYKPLVFRDEAAGLYRMYYQCFSGSNYWTRSGPSYYCCYAESADGLRWSKPEWQDAPFGGHPATNIITVGPEQNAQVQAPHVFHNPHAGDAAQAYGMIYNCAGLRLAWSPDGIAWTPAREDPLFAYHSDTSNNLFWNERLGRWVLYMRPPMYSSGRHEGAGKRHMRRRVAVSFSENLFDWTTPRTILYPDELDLSDIDAFYPWPYAGRYLGFITLMNQAEGGSTQVYLATSDDGLHWTRPPKREPWLRRGRDGDFDAGCVALTGPPIDRAGEFWFYYSAFPKPQCVFEQEGAIGLAKQMHGRFMGLEAGTDEFGWVLTKEFTWSGRTLVLNCRANRGDAGTFGRIHVEIVERPDDADPARRTGGAVEGFELDACDLIRSNSPRQVVSWQGNSDLDHLEGRRVYLRFRLLNATLFAFSMEA